MNDDYEPDYQEYEDDYEEYIEYDEFPPIGARDRIRMFIWRIRWFIRANFWLCPECHRRKKNCTCGMSDVPF